jgi:streptomycin 6-kinase
MPKALFERGEATYGALLQSSGTTVLLHGDLHHYNILSAVRSPWLAIDPHGLVGEPTFETGAYFGNPFGLMARPNPERTIARRADIFADLLGLDRERVIAWGFAYQMLSAVWSAENNGTGWKGAVAVAEILAAMH